MVFDPVNKLPFFFYQTGRDHRSPKKLLKHFADVLQCDGSSLYETLSAKLDALALMNCLAHISREFFDAQGNDAERATTALKLIKLLYEVEEKARNLGSHEAAQRTAMLYTFFAACKHHGIDPEKWLPDVLNRINDHKVSRLEELMPQNWKPATENKSEVPK